MVEQHSHGRSPWMFTTVILAILLVASMGMNFQLTGALLSGTAAVQTPEVPTTGQVIGDTGSGGGAGNILSVAGEGASRGSVNAPVVIVEFSDMQCPFCRRNHDSTEPQVMSNYINTGKVKHVYRHFPLSFHPAAQKSAEALECAREQDKFWELRGKIFEKQSEQGAGTVSYDGDADVKVWATEVAGLNVQALSSCMDSGKYSGKILQDLSEGSSAGVSGTPTFYIGRADGRGGVREIVGAQPYASFQQAIEAALAA